MPKIVASAICGSLGKSVVRTSSSKRIAFLTPGLASIAFFAFASTMAAKCATSADSALAAEAPSVVVPLRMQLTEVMKNSAGWLPAASLIPIDFSPTIGPLVTEKTEHTLKGPQAVAENAGLAGSLCFVVRRPG